MSADAVEQSDAQAEQAGKDISPFQLIARMKPEKTTVNQRKVCIKLFILPLPDVQS